MSRVVPCVLVAVLVGGCSWLEGDSGDGRSQECHAVAGIKQHLVCPHASTAHGKETAADRALCQRDLRIIAGLEAKYGSVLEWQDRVQWPAFGLWIHINEALVERPADAPQLAFGRWPAEVPCPTRPSITHEEWHRGPLARIGLAYPGSVMGSYSLEVTGTPPLVTARITHYHDFNCDGVLGKWSMDTELDTRRPGYQRVVRRQASNCLFE